MNTRFAAFLLARYPGLQVFVLLALFVAGARSAAALIGRHAAGLASLTWRQRHRRRAAMLAAPWQAIAMPALEEILFRFPLVFLFPRLSNYAWAGIAASAGIFAAVHLSSNRARLVHWADLRREVATADGEQPPSDDFALALRRAKEGTAAKRSERLKWHALMAGAAGAVFGTVAVWAGSALASYLLHCAWNAAMLVGWPGPSSLSLDSRVSLDPKCGRGEGKTPHGSQGE